MSAHAQRIESAQNPKLKRAAKRVKQSPAKNRAENVAWCEGLSLVYEVLARAEQTGTSVLEVWLPESLWNNPQWQEWSHLADHIDVFEIPNGLYGKLSGLPSSTGPLVFFTPPSTATWPTKPTDWVVLDQIQDPGNLGTMLRTCAAAGIRHVGLTEGCAWPWGDKALRAGMGAQWAVTVHKLDASQAWPGQDIWVTHLDSNGVSLYDCELSQPSVWIFGNEGQGVSSHWIEKATRTVHIPQVDQVESLNVAASCAVALFEQRRQRLQLKR